MQKHFCLLYLVMLHCDSLRNVAGSGLKYVLDSCIEYVRQAEGQWERGIEMAFFDRNYRLPTHSKLF